MVILMTIAPPHQTRDDHGDEDEGCLGQDNNECFALKFVMILKKRMITKKVQLCDDCRQEVSSTRFKFPGHNFFVFKAEGTLVDSFHTIETFLAVSLLACISDAFC